MSENRKKSKSLKQKKENKNQKQSINSHDKAESLKTITDSCLKLNIDKGKVELDDSKYTLDLVNSWINSTDNKVAVSCGIISIVMAVMTFVSENVASLLVTEMTTQPNECFYFGLKILMIVTVVLFLTSVFFHFFAIIPRNTTEKEAPYKYSIFFDKISKFPSVDDYIKSVKAATKDDFEYEVMEEIYFNSGICSIKMLKFKIGIILGIIAIIMTGVCSAFYVAMYN